MYVALHSMAFGAEIRRAGDAVPEVYSWSADRIWRALNARDIAYRDPKLGEFPFRGEGALAASDAIEVKQASTSDRPPDSAPALLPTGRRRAG